MTIKIGLIGLGHQGASDYLPAINGNHQLQLSGVCDRDAALVNQYAKEYDVAGYTDIDVMLAETELDIAVVAIPHNAYEPVIAKLAQKGIHVLKEKPVALTMAELQSYISLQDEYKINIMVSAQRRFDKRYRMAKTWLDKIGDIYSAEFKYTCDIRQLDQGWRAGASAHVLADMGYHILDVINWLFGLPTTVSARAVRAQANQLTYTAADTATLSLEVPSTTADKKAIVSVYVSRHYPKKCEKVRIIGSQGAIKIKGNDAFLFDASRKQTCIVQQTAQEKSALFHQQVNHFTQHVTGQANDTFINSLSEHSNNYALMAASLESAEHGMTLQVNKYCPDHSLSCPWPVVTAKSQRTVLEQMHTTMSIYDNSGIFKTFEDRFKAMTNRPYALVTNSGTSALFALYEGINLEPEDEVIAPVYTFFATVSPISQFGAKIRFCDCDVNGNIDPEKIEALITAKTKAIVVTHMWGIPCQMDRIVEIAKEHNLKILEDCSHAHGAMFNGQVVGSFGDGAAWSLQGQKIITGGEGGVLVTNDPKIYERALLQGHYNKRPIKELTKDSDLYEFSLTGFGLKLRAHPLAIQFANGQLDHLDNWLKCKRLYVSMIADAIREIPFLSMPQIADNVQPAWYALVLQFDEERAGVSLNEFCQELKARGVTEVDQPKSTCPLDQLPLFTQTAKAVPRHYSTPMSIWKSEARPTFINAYTYYAKALKLPVWTQPEDIYKVKRVIKILQEYAKTLGCGASALTQKVSA